MCKKTESEKSASFDYTTYKNLGIAYYELDEAGKKDYMEVVHRYLAEIADDLYRNNRFFASGEFVSELKEMIVPTERYRPLMSDIELDELDRQQSEKTIGTLYRARIYLQSDMYKQMYLQEQGKLEGKFKGYDKDNSGAPPKALEGRMNPVGVCMLYAATDKVVAIREVNPGYDDIISIATCKIKKPLKIAELHRPQAFCDSNESWLLNLTMFLNMRLSYGGNNPKKDYCLPQFVAAFCKNAGYDGLTFRSRFFSIHDTDDDKYNIVIFEPENCEIVSSELFRAADLGKMK
jgi:hypothetical protein